MNVDEATFAELVSIARQRGSLSMEDLRKAVPIDSMTIEDISDVLARLDAAGFDLEGDPDLLSSTRSPSPKIATISKPEPTGLPETVPESGRPPLTLPTSAGDPIPKRHTARRSDAVAAAPMLPWVAAFVIVVLIVFAAFAV